MGTLELTFGGNRGRSEYTDKRGTLSPLSAKVELSSDPDPDPQNKLRNWKE